MLAKETWLSYKLPKHAFSIVKDTILWQKMCIIFKENEENLDFCLNLAKFVQFIFFLRQL